MQITRNAARAARWMAAVMCAAAALPGRGEPTGLNWRMDSYEPVPPRLADALDGATLTVSGQWSVRGPHFVTDGKVEANNH
jgi:hypothetical protein